MDGGAQKLLDCLMELLMRLSSGDDGKVGATERGVEGLKSCSGLDPGFSDAQGICWERPSELLREAGVRRFGAHQIVAKFGADFLDGLGCRIRVGEDRLRASVEDEAAKVLGHLEGREVGPAADQHRYQMGVRVGRLETGRFVEQLKNLLRAGIHPVPHILDLDEGRYGDRTVVAIQDRDVRRIVERTTGYRRPEDDSGLTVVSTLSRVSAGSGNEVNATAGRR